MCFGGGGGSVDQSVNIQSAALSREQYNDYVTRFQPIESQVIGSIMSADGTTLGNDRLRGQAIDRASEDVTRQFGVAEDATVRNMGRMGVELTPDRQRTMDRSMDLGRSLSTISARNNTRVGVEDRDLKTASNMASLGRGIAADANSTMGSAASLANQRNVANQQAAQAKSAQTQSAVLGAAGIAAAIFA